MNWFLLWNACLTAILLHAELVIGDLIKEVERLKKK